MITVIDYGVGNFGSIQNMLRVAGYASELTSDIRKIGDATKIILPGIGAFDPAMKRLNHLGLTSLLRDKATQGTPLLGICLGAQLLTRQSEEGQEPGLGLIDAVCVKFDANQIRPFKVPHMGWDEIDIIQVHQILESLAEEEKPRFYFAHSYYMTTAQRDLILAQCNYGHVFDCVLGNKNVIAAQFHPEKSHKFGLRMITNFAKWNIPYDLHQLK